MNDDPSCNCLHRSNAVNFQHAQRSIDAMFERWPPDVSPSDATEIVLAQLIARLAFERSPSAAAQYLAEAARYLRQGGILRM